MYEHYISELTNVELKKEKYQLNLRVENNDDIMMECPVHGCSLVFKILRFDSYYLFPKPCPLCIEEAKEAGRKEIEHNLWDRIIDKIKTWQKEATND